MSKIIGIDLGTTSARVAVWENGSARIIENSEGYGTTPCYVAINEDGERLVGEAARRYALQDPSNVVYAIKRIIGRTFSDPEIPKLQAHVPYLIVEGPDGNAWVRLQGKDYSPVQISAFILQKMKMTAEAYLGEPVHQAVVTVPAYFSEVQRIATKCAAEIAGLNILRIIAEPTAAALAYGIRSGPSETIAIYDLGGGTFDVSILEIGDGVFEVLSSRGDMMLGGEDLDYLIYKELGDRFLRQTGINLSGNALARLRLKQAAEDVKIQLSFAESARIELPFISRQHGQPVHFNTTLTRAEFEQLISPLIDRSIAVCGLALNDAGYDSRAIERVIFVGGSTRMPIVDRKVSQYFAQKPYGGLRREDAVALGAAIQCGVFSGELKDAVLIDVLPRALGVRILPDQFRVAGKFVNVGDFPNYRNVFHKENRALPQDYFYPIIDSNTSFPTKKIAYLDPVNRNRSRLTFEIFEGTAESVRKCDFIGKLNFITTPNMPPHPEGQLELVLDIDANKNLNASVIERATNRTESVLISGQLDLPDEYDAMKADTLRSTVTDRVEVGAAGARSASPSRTREVADEPPPPPPQTAPEETAPTKPSVFLSYAHEDDAWMLEIYKVLSVLKRAGKIDLWIDKDIRTGEQWEEKIYDAIRKSNTAILLLSLDFLNSDFILNDELPMLMAEHERRQLALWPILVRPCPYELFDNFSRFQMFNPPEKPLSSIAQAEREAEFVRLAKQLSQIT